MVVASFYNPTIKCSPWCRARAKARVRVRVRVTVNARARIKVRYRVGAKLGLVLC